MIENVPVDIGVRADDDASVASAASGRVRPTNPFVAFPRGPRSFDPRVLRAAIATKSGSFGLANAERVAELSRRTRSRTGWRDRSCSEEAAMPSRSRFSLDTAPHP